MGKGILDLKAVLDKGQYSLEIVQDCEDKEEVTKEPEIIGFELIPIEEKQIDVLTNKELAAVLGAIDFIICEIDDDEDLKSAKKKLEEIEKRR